MVGVVTLLSSGGVLGAWGRLLCCGQPGCLGLGLFARLSKKAQQQRHLSPKVLMGNVPGGTRGAALAMAPWLQRPSSARVPLCAFCLVSRLFFGLRWSFIWGDGCCV